MSAFGGGLNRSIDSRYLSKTLLKNEVYGLLGHMSRKTTGPLFAGEVKDFKAKIDAAKISDDVVVDRLAFADRAMRALPDTSKINTPERTQLRQHIAETLYDKDVDKRLYNKEATIVLGLPGSGKSTFADQHLTGGALMLDGDNAKNLMPEFDSGRGAFAVHEESSEIMRGVMRRAVSNGDNIVWPRIDSKEKIVQDVESLVEAGYKVHVRLIDTDAAEAAKSAIYRFLESGRYVPPHMIKDYGTSSRD